MTFFSYALVAESQRKPKEVKMKSNTEEWIVLAKVCGEDKASGVAE